MNNINIFLPVNETKMLTCLRVKFDPITKTFLYPSMHQKDNGFPMKMWMKQKKPMAQIEIDFGSQLTVDRANTSESLPGLSRLALSVNEVPR